MNKTYYLVCGVILFDRHSFEDLVIQRIHEDKLYNLRNLTGVSIERSVKHHPLRLAKEIGIDVKYLGVIKDPEDRLEEITELCNYHLYNLANKKIDQLYEDYTQNRIQLDEYSEEWMFNLIDRISIALYC